MGNRVLRLDPVNFPLEKFLRIVFRDDDGQSVHANNVGDKLIDIFIGKKLGEGLAVASMVQILNIYLTETSLF